MNQPKVTVLLPVYNGAKYIREAIDSILAQTYRDFELLIIDDGSIDDTAEIIHSYAQQNKRVRIYQQPNQGLIATLNKGLELTRGKFIARIDQDDIMKPNRIEEQVSVLESHDNVAVVGSWMEVINEDGMKVEKWKLPYTSSDCDFSSYLYGDIPVGHPCVMYRAEVVRSIGGYRAEYVHAEDVDLWFRIELTGQSIINIPKCLTLYRQHDDQTTALYRKVSTNSRNKAFAYYLSKKLDCTIDSETAKSMIPVNYSNMYFTQLKQLDFVYELKLKMFSLFSQKHKLKLKETHKYAFRLWLSLLPLCKLRFTNPFQVIVLNTLLYFRLMNKTNYS
jgi:glycosyltransferase involved in cell wall biosynthesis